MKCKVEALGDQALVVLEGEITIQDITAVKNAFVKCMSDSRSVVIDVDRITRADLSFLQVLCAAHRQAGASGQALTFRGSKTERIQALVHESGYARRSGCVHDSDNTCLWMSGGQA